MKRFEELERGTQQKIIQFLVVGTVLLVWMPLYPLIPRIIRVFAFPLFFIGAVAIGYKIEPEAFVGWLRAAENSIRKIHPALKNVPGMAFLGILLVVSLSVAGFVWNWTAAIK